MKTLLKPYLIDFLKKQGYKYFLSRKTHSNDGPGSIILIPVLQRPAIVKPCIGFDSFFHISGRQEDINSLATESGIRVQLNRKDVVLLKKYLLRFF